MVVLYDVLSGAVTFDNDQLWLIFYQGLPHLPVIGINVHREEVKVYWNGCFCQQVIKLVGAAATHHGAKRICAAGKSSARAQQILVTICITLNVNTLPAGLGKQAVGVA